MKMCMNQIENLQKKYDLLCQIKGGWNYFANLSDLINFIITNPLFSTSLRKIESGKKEDFKLIGALSKKTHTELEKSAKEILSIIDKNKLTWAELDQEINDLKLV